MKVTITNKQAVARSIPMPTNTAVAIGALATVVLNNQPASREKFFKGLANYNFDVSIEKVDNAIKADEKVDPVTPVTPDPDNTTVDPVTPDPDDTASTSDTTDKVELTADEVESKLNQLTVDQLKEITSKLGINTSAQKVNTLVDKIFDGSNDDLNKIMEAYSEVVGD